MKVLLLNTSSRTGGAAVAADRLRSSLIRNGIDTSMLVRDKSEGDDKYITVNSTWLRRKINKFRFYFERIIIFLFNKLNRADLFRVSIANTGTDISKMEEVRNADIIHLHWINQGFLSLSDIRKLSALGKPIVWTMHDMWPCTGICHHARDCNKYHKKCNSCFYLGNKSGNDLSTKIFLNKAEIYKGADITFVGCSKWLTGRAKESALLINKNVLDIPNTVDQSIFRRKDKYESRRKFNLPLDKKLLLFGALNITDTRKGVDYLLKALSLIHKDDLELVVFGNIKSDIKQLIPVPIHPMGYLTEETVIADLYNAVDLFVTSSLEENLPNTIMESMACGTPCVGFEIGGIPEMIDHKKNGYVAKYKSAEDLAEGIIWVLDNPDREGISTACVDKVNSCYSEDIVAQKYIALYERLLAGKR